MEGTLILRTADGREIEIAAGALSGLDESQAPESSDEEAELTRKTSVSTLARKRRDPKKSAPKLEDARKGKLETRWDRLAVQVQIAVNGGALTDWGNDQDERGYKEWVFFYEEDGEDVSIALKTSEAELFVAGMLVGMRAA